MFKIETHAHTKPVSGCGQLTPSELMKAYNDVGYSGLTVTNHFLEGSFSQGSESELKHYMSAYYECENEGAKYGIKVYWGAEFRFSPYIQDFLVFGVTESMLRKMTKAFNYSFSDFHKLVNSEGGLFFQAHPFRHDTVIIPVSDLDGIEVYNMHAGHNSRNDVALALKENTRIPYATSGSDCHEYNAVGRGGIITKTLPENGAELCSLIRSGDYECIRNYDFNYETLMKG